MADDQWFDEFRRKAASRLKAVFEKDVGELPPSILERMEELRKKEMLLLRREKK